MKDQSVNVCPMCSGKKKNETATFTVDLKVAAVVVRKRFFDTAELKTVVYAALINLLEEKELIRTGPFDATVCRDRTTSKSPNSLIS